MYINDSMEEKYLKIKQMSTVDWYITNNNITTSLYNSQTLSSDADILVEINEDNILYVSIIANSNSMFKKYQGKKGHKLFENKMRDVLWNTKAEECISHSQIWNDSGLRKYEMFIDEVKLDSYKEVLNILDTVVSTVAKFYTTKKVV